MRVVLGVIDLDRRNLLKVAGAAGILSAIPLARYVAEADTRKIKIGMIGSGQVGSVLGGVWARAGHQVMFSSRNLDHDKKLATELAPNAHAGTSREAAEFGEVLVFSVPYSALPELGKTLVESYKAKVVIDTCNPEIARDGEIAVQALKTGPGLFEAQLLPGARIVRTFNGVSAEMMASAHEHPLRFGMPMASDDKKAIEVASGLIREVGYEPVLIGGLNMGKHLMPCADSPLFLEHTPEQIRDITATLQP